jgi:D-amino-acid dehydrogenase
MKIVVVGSGLLGISTAHWLSELGAQVTVLDRAGGPARETSFANGALVTPSMSDPWNAPGVLWRLLGWLGREDSPMLLRPKALPSLAGWGLRFLRESSERRFHANTLANLRLASYSLATLRELRTRIAIDYDHGTVGTLKVIRNSRGFAAARSMAAWIGGHGVSWRELDRGQTLALEPSLAPIGAEIAGSIHFPDDEHGDARRFCEALAARAATHGVEFRYSTTIDALEYDGRRVRAVRSRNGAISADAFVIAAGSFSPQLLRGLGIRLPVAPVKGYSITVPMPADVVGPVIPILDDELHAVAAPLDTKLRIAGTAEFAGHDLSVPESRIENLVRLLNRTFPTIARAVQRDSIQPWSGLRPMSADGVPIVGRTPIDNLFLNTGHGHLGWTMAAGSGRALADLIVGRTPDVDLTPYSLTRFG